MKDASASPVAVPKQTAPPPASSSSSSSSATAALPTEEELIEAALSPKSNAMPEGSGGDVSPMTPKSDAKDVDKDGDVEMKGTEEASDKKKPGGGLRIKMKVK